MAMAGQPSACAPVGAWNEASNQVRVAGEKFSRAVTPRRYQGLVTSTDRYGCCDVSEMGRMAVGWFRRFDALPVSDPR